MRAGLRQATVCWRHHPSHPTFLYISTPSTDTHSAERFSAANTLLHYGLPSRFAPYPPIPRCRNFRVTPTRQCAITNDHLEISCKARSKCEAGKKVVSPWSWQPTKRLGTKWWEILNPIFVHSGAAARAQGYCAKRRRVWLLVESKRSVSDILCIFRF